jgi:Zn-dependent peptidase ImmA (M78 family)
MIDLPMKTNIEKISLDILKQSKSLDIFPTPVDKIIQYTNLHFEKSIDLSKINKSFILKFTDKISAKYLEAMGLVRGILDRRDKVVYLDLSQRRSRQNFIKLHETGHEALYWQNNILEYLEDEGTLDLLTQEEFEAEANYFASITLFQQDRFENEIKYLELGIKTPMHLADKFGASIHATLRRYVECSMKRCALLVLEKISQKGEVPQCLKRDYFQSKKFTKSFGEIDLPDKFGYTWAFTQDYYNRKRFHENGLITLMTKNGNVLFKYHFFDSTYNAFVFLFPQGDISKTRTKIFLSNS